MKSLHGTLISLGFADVEKSSRFLAAPELDSLDREQLLKGFAFAADPDLALQSLVRILAAREPLASQVAQILKGPESAQEPVFRLLGASEALADFLIRNPDEGGIFGHPLSAEPLAVPAESLREALLRAVGSDPYSERPVARKDPALATLELRKVYRRKLAELALRDLSAASPTDALPTVAAELADLAGAAVEAGLAVARADLARTFPATEIAAVDLAVIGMGKTGARELNYISDVDVIYVVESRDLDSRRVVEIGTALASTLARVISAPGREPGLWELDANLRPEGKDGPLVRTLESHLEYYRRWARNWEFQALLKARTLAGSRSLGQRYEAAIEPLIWNSSEREGFVESVQAMRRRVSDHIPEAEKERQLKLGIGGLRDVEFTVQLLQLVHGKTDPGLRRRDTTGAIAALAAGGYIGRSDGAELDAAYRYLRVLEHRIQLVQMRRTHLLPTSSAALRALARSSQGAFAQTRPSAEALLEQWRGVKRQVRALHERIFYRPLLATTAHLSAEETALSPAAAQARLAALGYRDSLGAMRHIQALTAGVSRRAALQRQLLPVLLGWLAEGVDPDGGLLAFRRLSESLGASHWYLGMLRDSQAAAERLCHVLSSSRLVADLLEVSPEQTAWLGSDKDLEPLSLAAQWQEILAKMSRNPEPEKAMRLIRLIRRRELLRIALADSAGVITAGELGHALSDADQAAVLGALRVAELEAGELQTSLLVVGMGRQGGREISYGSDADVLFVHRPLPGADPERAQQQAQQLAARVSALLSHPLKPAVLAERELMIDAGLRPEGRDGPLARSLESYQEYYARWSLVWEAQALLRARPLAGDDALAADFLAWADTIRYPVALPDSELREVRRIKARVEAERLPRGADPSRHLKLGRGGLSDVEWLVQLMQLQHAHEYPALRTTSTLQALAALGDTGLLPAVDAALLARSWRLATRIRSSLVLWSGKSSDILPSAGRDLEAVARWCGYPPGSGAQLEEDYLRLTRQARAVFEEHFYGN
ncbi:bifunctional [glutamine synthetase] adenylyltransferase/[glutamine synthetase]-adenylyl-L-tyrosine phosphorylase [Psychromicrobium xiongbiense]|uniref:bifunctional [glutamine synthetase] adenylyltransferase/[glutamine synthetase]-adenylyl-L-tyrosine phosphorylase n=1 Tax=Psychromicrobium xiongbiense TaxID=3051184 RepID=UPI0025562D70|nr:bifunctional [glutamine synthetase] adenylyltransferase/[glutamine synthetase]-adenylyl-L-tyrosine phosphorylase [Psychromicrobium sp. YIM S02556]